jgi:low affinity Fe/Cu permease
MAKVDPRETLFTGPSDAGFFDRFAHKVTRVTGSHYAFLVALAIVLTWAATGPVFHFSNTWQLVINTGTTVVTFMMVFVIQQSQNKDTIAIQLKLNELIAATKGASNRLIDVEDLNDDELDLIKAFYVRLSARAKLESDICQTHSLSEDDDGATKKLPDEPSKD